MKKTTKKKMKKKISHDPICNEAVLSWEALLIKKTNTKEKR